MSAQDGPFRATTTAGGDEDEDGEGEDYGKLRASQMRRRRRNASGSGSGRRKSSKQLCRLTKHLLTFPQQQTNHRQICSKVER